jgi:pilus assembly protein Flp/PilA
MDFRVFLLQREAGQSKMLTRQTLPHGGNMQSLGNYVYLLVRGLIEREEGQDLVEYALVVALIAFGAITGMGFLANGLNNAFSDIAVILNSNI